MKLCIIYHPNSESARNIEEFIRDFKRRQPESRIELLSLETQEGAAQASLYGVMQYPALLALRNDGQLLKMWEGPTLPLMDEIAAYSDAEVLSLPQE